MITDRNYDQPRFEPDRGRPIFSDDDPFQDEPGEQTRPDIEPAVFLCRCICGCREVATVWLYCKNCSPEAS